MKRRISHILNIFKNSLFWRLFFMYLLCVLLFLSATVYSVNQMVEIWKSSYISEQQAYFDHNCEELTADILACYYIPDTLYTNESYRILCNQSDLHPARYSYYRMRVVSALPTFTNCVPMAEKTVVYLQKPGLLFDSSRSYTDLEACFSEYIIAEHTDFDSVLNAEYSFPSSFRLLKEDRVTIENTTDSYLILLLSHPKSRAIFLYFLKSEDVTDIFQFRSLPEGSSLVITDFDGNPLLQRGTPTASDIRFSTSMDFLSSGITLSIPESYFDHIAADIRNRQLRKFLYFTVIGLLLCVLFSKIGVAPVRKIIKDNQLPDGPGELTAISSYILSSQVQQRSLRNRLLGNLLTRAFFGLPLSERDAPSAAGLIKAEGLMQLAIIRLTGCTDAPEQKEKAIIAFQQTIPEDFISVILNSEEIGVMFRSTENCSEVLDAVIEQNPLPASSGCFLDGISDSFGSYLDVYPAVQTALKRLAENTYSRGVLSADGGTAAEPLPLESDFNRFRHALFDWDTNEIRRLFSDYKTLVLVHSLEYGQKTYYMLLALIQEVADAVQFPADIFSSCIYSPKISAAANIGSLEQLMEKVISFRQSKMLSVSQIQKQEVIDYINSSFSDPNFSMDNLVQHFQKSEHSLSRIIHDISGMSFPAYLQDVRMKHAGFMLRTGNYRVYEVCNECGLQLSTFHRNFKKYYGMTPAEYQASLRNQQQE